MNPEIAPQNNVPNPDVEEPNLEENLNPTVDETEQEAPEHSTDDMEGLHRAAAGATDVLEGAINGDRKINTSYTQDGLRGVVEANVSGGTVQGQFEGSELKRVELGLEGDNTITVVNPESANPKALFNGEPVDPDKMPAVEQVIQEIKTATAAKNEESLPVELAPEDKEPALESEDEDSEKIAA
jgi:hypothetical protein